MQKDISMTIGELRSVIELLNDMNDWETVNIFINNKKVFLEDVGLHTDNGYADLFIEVKGDEKVNRK